MYWTSHFLSTEEPEDVATVHSRNRRIKSPAEAEWKNRHTPAVLQGNPEMEELLQAWKHHHAQSFRILKTQEIFGKEAVWEVLPFKDGVNRLQHRSAALIWLLTRLLPMLWAGSDNEDVSFCTMEYSFGELQAQFCCLLQQKSLSECVMTNPNTPFLHSVTVICWPVRLWIC